MEACPEVVQGFKVMKLKFKEESKCYHQILWKRHNVRVYDELKPPGRTLFVINVPPYCTESSFKRLFSKYGKVENIYFQKKASLDTKPLPKHPRFDVVEPVKGFKVAYIVYSHEEALRQAMSASSSEELVLSTPDNPVLTGMAKWCQEYNSQYVSQDVLGEEIKAVMADYEKGKEEEKTAASKEEEPDEDGWVTVTSKKTKQPKLLKKTEFKRKTKRKKKEAAELVKFYSFQQRQSKIDKLAELRKRFEEDKKRINMMKSSRKFRP